MKKIFRLISALGFVLAALMLSGFTDLPEDHWAYNSVQTLVAEGTVSGMPDGSFHPNDPVTRAQFVKMLGYRLSEPRDSEPLDLIRTHWAYDNLMHSPIRLVNGLMLPNRPMTREQVAVYVYDCYGNSEKSHAPSVITNGTDYVTEVGWVYEHGIMTGSDGLDLRLDDGLTRAEAAELIVKSRNAHDSDFSENVPESMLKQIFNGSALFDVDYDPGAVLTNGQIARAAYRLRLDRVVGLWYDEKADFEHPYANDLKAMEAALGSGRISADFADAPAMPEDALAMLGYGMMSKVHSLVGFGTSGEYYLDAKPAGDTVGDYLTFFWRYGIQPCGGGLIRSGSPVTHKMIASVLLQCDMLWGLHTSVTVDGESVVYNDEPMRLADLPVNASAFQSIPASVPASVPDLPFYSADGEEIELDIMPKVNYPFCNDLRDAFVSYFSGECARIYAETGVRLKLTYYPQLVYDNGAGYVVRIKAEADGADSRSLLGGLASNAGPDGAVWVDCPLSYTFLFE